MTQPQGIGLGMPDMGETLLILHGLDTDKSVVRADVFARKLAALINGLRAADKFINGKVSFDYMIEDLSIGSARTRIRERKRTTAKVDSSVRAYGEVAAAIYNGDISKKYPLPLVRHVQKLCAGADKLFSHGEMSFGADNIIRIDDFLVRQSRNAGMAYDASNARPTEKFFHGVSFGSFDGVLEEVDARGSETMIRGKLIPSGGLVEIDCVMNRNKIPDIITKFTKRAYVSGMVHYDDTSPLPVRIDVTDIELLNDGTAADLTRWRGAFSAELADADDEAW